MLCFSMTLTWNFFLQYAFCYAFLLIQFSYAVLLCSFVNAVLLCTFVMQFMQFGYAVLYAVLLTLA